MRPRGVRRSRSRRRRCSTRSPRSNRWWRPCGLELYRALTTSGLRVRRALFGLSKRILRPPLPGLRHLRYGDQSTGFTVITCIDAKYIADGEALIGPPDDPDLLAGLHLAFGDDPQVRPGPHRLGEAAREHLVIHPNPEPPAGNARLGHLKHSTADLPALADKRVVHLDPFGGEILAKLAGRKRSADLVSPPPCVFARVRVHRFVGPAVCLAIRLVVPGKVHPPDGNPSGDRRFPNRTLGRAPVVLKLARPAHVDRENRSCGACHRFLLSRR